MKQLLKNALLSLCFTSLALLVSCGDGGGSGNETNDNTAPTTLNGTALSFSGLEFNFNRLSGDATSGGTETGFANSFTPTQTTFSTVSSDGTTNTYDMPTLISNVSYTYQKTGDNSGTVIIRGDGTAPSTTTEVTTNPDGSTTESTSNPAVFVNQPDGSQFIATVAIVFGSQSEFVENISAAVDVVGTSDGSSFGFTSDSTSGSTSFLLQDGTSVPIQYNLTDSESVTKKAASLNLVPSSLQTTGRLIMDFDDDNPTVTSGTPVQYSLLGTSSDDQGFNDVTDQGLFNLFISYLSGNTATFVSIPYSWSVEDSGGTRALLTLEIPSSVNPDGTAITERVEQYAFEFNTTETGRFVQVQPDTTLSIKGSFDFPFADQINN